MTKLVVLKLDGNLQQGVGVTLAIATEGANPYKEVAAYLPPVAELITKIDKWRSVYRSLGNSTRTVKAIKVTYHGSINQKYEDCRNSASELKKRLNNWLREESFRPIRETWLKELKENESTRVLISTSSQQLRQIPWHFWDLVEEYPNIELGLSTPDYQYLPKSKTPTYRNKVKILAIFGNSTDIDVDADRRLLENLPDADVTFLVQPQRHEINDSLWEQAWDILFFAGHSKTVGDCGRIYINDFQNLTVDELKYGLKKAISNGLALAIFNSCDGLGLAYELEALHIPQIIVMREPVPDAVAQTFLKHFLVAFAADGTLYQAVKEARLKLHGLEDKYPCASLLPVICQNAGAVPPCWLDLGRRPTQISPYRGLFAFTEIDAQFFFGRETFTQILVEAVGRQPFVAVIGSSGSGKSSVVYAGLVRRLRNTGNWDIVDFRPGSRPLFALATALVSQKEIHLSRTERLRSIRNLAADLKQCDNALRDVVDDILCSDPNKRLLLLADQFEELYTLCRDSQERKAFLDRLLEAVATCHNFSFIITLRADFLGQALSYRPFADALQYADLKLGPMTDCELQAAIEKPAALLGVTISEGLAERILRAVSAEPGNLPLLEFALTQLWAKQVDAHLTHTAYDQIGGVEAALARYADEVYNQLNYEEKERAQRIFIQLVHPGMGSEDTRRVATRAEVGEENWDLVTRLADSRLVVTGRFGEIVDKNANETVEFVHEALIRSWGQLHIWMQQDRDFRCWQEQLRMAMRAWENSSFDLGALLRGKPLVDAEYWQGKRFLELSSLERSFIALSVELRERESKNGIRRRRLTILILTFATVLALTLAGVASWHFQNARIKSIEALSTSSEAFFASNQQLEGLTAAIEAGQQLRSMSWVKTDTKTSVINALQNVLYRIKEYNRLEGHKNKVMAVSFSPQGNMIGTVGRDGTVKLWNSDSMLQNIPWLNNLKNVSALAFSPKYQIIATAINNKIILWTLDGEKKRTLSVDKGNISALAFSSNGKMIAAASTENRRGTDRLHIWNSDNGTLLKILEDALYMQMKIVFSPDGKMIASADWYGVKVFQTDTWQKIFDTNGGISVDFSPDSQMLVTGTNNKVNLWKRNKFGGFETYSDKSLEHGDAVWSVSFSLDGQMIASGSEDKTVKVWKPDGTLLNTFQGHKSVVRAVAFSPDSQTIASASDDGSIKLWKPKGTSLKALEHHSGVFAVAFSPDGDKIATANGHGLVTLWSRDGMLLKTEKCHNGQISTLVFSPDNQLIITAAGDREVKLWKTDGTPIKTLEGHTGEAELTEVVRASFSSDSQMFAIVDIKGKIELWNSQGKLLKTLQTQGNKVLAISFSPDSQMIAAASQDGIVKFWKPDGKLQKTVKNLGDITRVVFSPDGEIIATASTDKTVKLWNSQGKLLKTIAKEHDEIRALAFSPNGKILVIGNTDATVNLWSQEGAFLKTITKVSDFFRIAFSPDSKTLALASRDGTVILSNLEQDLNLDELLKLGCNWGRQYFQTNPKVSNSNKHLCPRNRVVP